MGGSTFERGRLVAAPMASVANGVVREEAGGLPGGEGRFPLGDRGGGTSSLWQTGSRPSQDVCFRHQPGGCPWIRHKRRKRHGASDGGATQRPPAGEPGSAWCPQHPRRGLTKGRGWAKEAFSFGRLEACKAMKSWASPVSARVHLLSRVHQCDQGVPLASSPGPTDSHHGAVRVHPFAAL